MSLCPGAVSQCPWPTLTPLLPPPQNQSPPKSVHENVRRRGRRVAAARRAEDAAGNLQSGLRAPSEKSLDPCPPLGRLPGSTLSGSDSKDPFWKDHLQLLSLSHSLHYEALFRALIPRGPDTAPTTSNILHVPCESLLLPQRKAKHCKFPRGGGGGGIYMT